MVEKINDSRLIPLKSEFIRVQENGLINVGLPEVKTTSTIFSSPPVKLYIKSFFFLGHFPELY